MAQPGAPSSDSSPRSTLRAATRDGGNSSLPMTAQGSRRWSLKRGGNSRQRRNRASTSGVLAPDPSSRDVRLRRRRDRRRRGDTNSRSATRAHRPGKRPPACSPAPALEAASPRSLRRRFLGKVADKRWLLPVRPGVGQPVFARRVFRSLIAAKYRTLKLLRRDRTARRRSTLAARRSDVPDEGDAAQHDSVAVRLP